ncbi:MAG: hypothetical protein F4Y53_00970 [Proteobacteria bacterium]|nr:hypothetical protein [Pseudomonadota bacterium]
MDFSKPSIPFIADADDMAMMQAAELGEKTVFSKEWIDVHDLVPLTEEAWQVKSYLMQVHMMVLHNGVGRFPLRDSARPPACGRQHK